MGPISLNLTGAAGSGREVGIGKGLCCRPLRFSAVARQSQERAGIRRQGAGPIAISFSIPSLPSPPTRDEICCPAFHWTWAGLHPRRHAVTPRHSTPSSRCSPPRRPFCLCTLNSTPKIRSLPPTSVTRSFFNSTTPSLHHEPRVSTLFVTNDPTSRSVNQHSFSR